MYSDEMSEQHAAPRIPVATFRLQFNRFFGFAAARAIIPYLHDLGISDVYSSPYLKAREGSMHGYDIIDHNSLNPEVGTAQEYDELVQELWKHRMGQVLDIVPNHMCIESKDNFWWMDVLENGQNSIYSGFFDIDWTPVKKELQNKVLLPVLGDQYGRILENQELQLSYEEGTFFVNYYEHKFPLNPKTYIYVLRHRIQSLKKALPADSRYFTGLLNIIGELKQLPLHTGRNHEKIIERHHKKERIKRQLWKLTNKSREMKSFIEVNIRIFNGSKGKPRSFDLMDKLLDKQAYRLSYWRVATEEINYRRFFDINELVSIRVEDPDVLAETHKLLFSLIQEKKVTGLRIDHPDGLYDPSEYFYWLQRNCFLNTRLGHMKRLKADLYSKKAKVDVIGEIEKQYEEIRSSERMYKPFYIVGEKILTKGERMPEEWPIFSTTGYVFLNSLNGIFVDTKNARSFDRIYSKFVKSNVNYHDIAYETKNLIMRVSMSSEINTLGHCLNSISEKNRHTRDFTLNSLIAVIKEVIAFFPVYRTYINSFTVSDRDRQYVELAVSKARRKNPAVDESIFNFLKDVLLLQFPDNFMLDDKKEWLDFVMKFQQVTGPVMAKGIEDTAFYVYNRLVSLNEVGGIPERFGTPLEAFHGQNIERSKFWPHALLATSTHDTKRSEDVRARINVLSEIPEEWRKRLILWNRMNRKKRIVVDGQKVPDPNEEYLLYQTLIGVWPVDIEDESGFESVKGRVKDYMLKAVREAKVNTSWINPNMVYEEAIMLFIDRVLNSSSTDHFLDDFMTFQKKISQYGMFNSLSQVLLKIASPGVPDFYQGSDLWNFSLVDPDNRRPVDYGKRVRMLSDLKEKERRIGTLELFKEIFMNRNDGRIKLYVTHKALAFRGKNRELFEKGEYLPLEAQGDRTGHICAFGRRLSNRRVIAAVPRLVAGLIPDPHASFFGKDVWKDSYLVIPFSDAGTLYRNIFTGEILSVKKLNEANALSVSEVFSNASIALLEKIGRQKRSIN